MVCEAPEHPLQASQPAPEVVPLYDGGMVCEAPEHRNGLNLEGSSLYDGGMVCEIKRPSLIDLIEKLPPKSQGMLAQPRERFERKATANELKKALKAADRSNTGGQFGRAD
jgi:hypothetical protein